MLSPVSRQNYLARTNSLGWEAEVANLSLRSFFYHLMF